MLNIMSKKIYGLKEITHQYKNYLFDLDGVIVHTFLLSGWEINKFKAQLMSSGIY
jgi:hypothetical protein